MLVYHAAHDLSHGMFRMIQLVDQHPQKSMPWDTLRILDFYFLFPHLLASMQMPRALLKHKKKFAAMSSKYNQIPAPRLFFQQLKGLHENTARSLIAKDLLDSQQFVAGIAARTARALPAALGALIEAQPPDEHSLSILLATELSLLQLGGDNGLKARTGLLEHRYDAV